MEDRHTIVRLVLWMVVLVLVLTAVLAIVGCTEKVNVHTDTRCETPGSVILDNNDFACWLAQESGDGPNDNQ